MMMLSFLFFRLLFFISISQFHNYDADADADDDTETLQALLALLQTEYDRFAFTTTSQ